MSLQKRYAMGMLSGAGSVALRTALNILVVPILIAKLGLDVFGLYIVLIAILEVATFLDLGATSALVTLLGSETNDLARRSLMKVGHVWFGVLTLLFGLSGFLLRDQLGVLFHIAPAMQAMAAAAFLLLLGEAMLSLYMCYARSILLSHCAHQWSNVADSVSNLLANLGSLAALLTGYGLVEIMAIRLLAAGLRVLLLMWQTLKLEPRAFRPGVPLDRDSLQHVARLSGHAMMINFSIIISHKIDDLVIAHFLPLSAVGIYEIVFRFLGVTLQVGLKLSEGLYAYFARLAIHQDVQEARPFFLHKSAFLNITTLLMLLPIVMFYPELFTLFSAGKIPMKETLPILDVALPCTLSAVLQMPANAWLFTWGHQRFVTVTSLVAAMANLCLSIILVQHLGIVGVALGTLIPQLIQHQWGLIGKTCQSLGIGALEYLRAVHMSTVWPLLIALGWILLWRPIVPLSQPVFHTILPAIGMIACSAAFIGAAVWFRFNATADDLKMLAPVNRFFVSVLSRMNKPKSKDSILHPAINPEHVS